MDTLKVPLTCTWIPSSDASFGAAWQDNGILKDTDMKHRANRAINLKDQSVVNLDS